MTDEPRPLAESLGVSKEQALANVSAAREVLKGATAPPPLGDDLDPGELAAERAVHLEQQRHTRWSLVCPQRFHHANLDWTRAEHGDDVADTIAEWQQQRPLPNLVLLGPVGTGKTGTALAAVKDDWIERGVDVKFMPTVELLDALKPGGDPHAIEDCLDVARLVVDDLGAQRDTDWTVERLYLIVNRRWMEERPIIVTANFDTPAELKEAVGERIYSRLVGDDAYVVVLSGEDRRRRKP